MDRVDKEHGQAIISATRPPMTLRMGGSETVGIVIKGPVQGNSQLSVLQVNAKNSQPPPIQLVSSDASVQGKPYIQPASTMAPCRCRQTP